MNAGQESFSSARLSSAFGWMGGGDHHNNRDCCTLGKLNCCAAQIPIIPPNINSNIIVGMENQCLCIQCEDWKTDFMRDWNCVHLPRSCRYGTALLCILVFCQHRTLLVIVFEAVLKNGSINAQPGCTNNVPLCQKRYSRKLYVQSS